MGGCMRLLRMHEGRCDRHACTHTRAFWCSAACVLCNVHPWLTLAFVHECGFNFGACQLLVGA